MPMAEWMIAFDEFAEAQIGNVDKQLHIARLLIYGEAAGNALGTVVLSLVWRSQFSIPERAHDQPVSHELLELR